MRQFFRSQEGRNAPAEPSIKRKKTSPGRVGTNDPTSMERVSGGSRRERPGKGGKSKGPGLWTVDCGLWTVDKVPGTKKERTGLP